jgi:hypothetical protein
MAQQSKELAVNDVYEVCPNSKCTDFHHFFDSNGIVRKEFLPPGQRVNHAFYKDVLERLRKRVQGVRKDIAGDWVLHTITRQLTLRFQ